MINVLRKAFFHRIALPLLAASLCFLRLAVPVHAASGPEMLGEILSKTEQNYQKIHAFVATFHQKTTSAAAGSLGSVEAQGRLYYAKPRQMRWEYDKPEEQVFVANNQFAWLYVRADHQVTLFDSDKLFATPMARTFFDGTLGLRSHFDVTLDPIQSTQDMAVLQLVPKQKDASIKVAYLWIDLTNYRISRIKTQDILGNTNEIELDSFEPLSSLDPSLFRLDIPDSTDVLGTDGRELSPKEIQELKARISSGK